MTIDDRVSERPFLGERVLRWSDYANGAIYMAALTGVALGTKPHSASHWTSSAEFEDDARNAFAASSESGRDTAAAVSDALMATTTAAPLLIDLGGGLWRKRIGREQAIEMAGEFLEAWSLTVLVTESTKVIASRVRPYQRECDADPDYEDDCFDRDSRASFFSGHASMAAVGAGLLCRNTYFREEPVWGRFGSLRNPIPCALGVGSAIATGFLRMGADKHWLGDVLVGWTVGFAVGLFDLPGPVDLLSFKYGRGTDAVSGTLLPSVSPKAAGVRLALEF
jgi:membrane-associated phospholipid phosphatase